MTHTLSPDDDPFFEQELWYDLWKRPPDPQPEPTPPEPPEHLSWREELSRWLNRETRLP